MKKSNTALLCLALSLLAGMVATGFILKKEATKINLNDSSRNYLTESIAAFKVLKISGSNGYPIEIEHSKINSIRVLRRRQSFLKTKTTGDTLEIIFSGANIPLERADQTTTPVGIHIQSNAVAQVEIKDTYTRVKNFRSGALHLQLKGKSSTDFLNCRFSTLAITAQNNSRLSFKQQNNVDTLRLDMTNLTLAYLKNINFSVLQHQVGDSATVVLSNQSLRQLHSSAHPL